MTTGSTVDETAAVVWARVEEGFFVASRAGQFVGFIDRTGDDAFIVHDGFSRRIGRYQSLADAMAVLDQRAVPSGNGSDGEAPR